VTSKIHFLQIPHALIKKLKLYSVCSQSVSFDMEFSKSPNKTSIDICIKLILSYHLSFSSCRLFFLTQFFSIQSWYVSLVIWQLGQSTCPRATHSWPWNCLFPVHIVTNTFKLPKIYNYKLPRVVIQYNSLKSRHDFSRFLFVF